MAKSVVKLEILRGAVIVKGDDGGSVLKSKGEVIDAPADYRHLVSGDDPACKVWEPSPEAAPESGD